MKILVPTDFSTNAMHATKYALLLAETLKAEIVLYHFVSIPVYSSDVPVVIPSEEELKQDTLNKLVELKDDFRTQYPNIKFSCEVNAAINFPEDAIINEETSCNSDLVVMGTRGSGLKRILGSNTSTVIENSNCPVIAVPEDAPLKVPSRIAFAVNYSEDDLGNILAMIDLFKSLNASITIVHIAEKHEDPAKADGELEGLLLRIRMESGYPSIHVKVLQSDDTYEGLDEFILSNKFDLLSVSMRKRSFADKLFGRSMTKRMLYHTHVPLMAFHTNV